MRSAIVTVPARSSARSSAAKRLVGAVLLLALAASDAPRVSAQAGIQGRWDTLPDLMPINPVHLTLLNNGRVLVVAGSGNVAAETNFRSTIWDPQAGTFSTRSHAWDMFCNGAVVLPDGRVLINGGNKQYDPFRGYQKNALYDPATDTFTDVENMAHGRWYPTPTVLGDGRVMTFSGLDELTGATNKAVEIYTAGSGWSPEYIANWTPPLYPRMHLISDGRVFYSGSGRGSRLFDPSTKTWSAATVATTNFSGTRGYGTSVLLPLSASNGYASRVMIFGGGNPATNTTEIIDLSAVTKQWQWGPPMSQGRIQLNATILPNGKVLVMGGSVNDEQAATASLNADLYDPKTNTFSPAAANVYPRLYHSGSLLLPDGTVALMGGNPTRGSYEQHVEIYSPAYLFNGDGSPALRPTITSASDTMYYGHGLQVQTPDAGQIQSVALVRPGSQTHAFDMDQRLVELSFTKASGSLTVTAPPHGNIAPPGYYMLFILNSAGVPSLARFVRLAAGSPANQAPTATIDNPSSNMTIDPGGSISFAGSGSDPDGNVASYAWTFDGGSPAASTEAAPGAVTYSTPGSYSASLIVTDDDDDASVAATRTITVADFSLSATPASRSVPPGADTTYTATVGPIDGFTGNVSFDVLGLPSGASASFTPASVSSAGSTMLAVSTSASTPVGTHTLTVNGTSGPITRSTTVTLIVAAANQAPSATITSPSSNMTINPGGSISFAGSGSDSDGNVASYAWSFGGGSPAASTEAAPGAVTYSTPGSYSASLIVTDDAGTASVLATRTITVADFSLSATPASHSVLPGAGTTYTATVAPIDGFTGNVSFDVLGLPSGASASFTPASVASAGSTTLGVSTSASTPVGTHTLTVRGTSGPITRSTTVTLIVAANQAPTATITSPASNVTVNPGGSISFAGSGSDPDGNVASYAWSFGGGSPAASTEAASGAVTYSTPGSYTASLIVTDNAGAASVAATRTITVANFSLSATPASRSVLPAAGTTYTATVGSINGFTGNVGFDVLGLPSGASASFTPASVSSAGSTTLAVSTSASTPTGTHTLTINGTSGPITRSTTVTLVVAANQAPTATITSPASNVTVNPGGSISFAGSGSDPDGNVASYAWSFGGGSPAASTQAAPGAVTYSTPGSFSASLIVTDSAGAASVPATRTITVADFSLSATPGSRSVLPEAGTTYTATVVPSNGFTGNVTFDVLGLPSGASASFTPASVASSGSTTLAVSTSASTPAGNYPLTIRGTSGPITRTTPVTLIVAGTFSISVSPPSRTVPKNGSTTYVVTLVPESGFTGPVTFSISSLPKNVTARFSPTSVTTSGTTTLMLDTKKNVALGTYTLTVRGTSNGQVRSVPITLIVQ